MVSVVSGLGLPRLPTLLLERPRLSERLAQWAGITVLRGGSGFGKTTAAASWAHDVRRQACVAWASASPVDDSDELYAAIARQLDDEMAAPSPAGAASRLRSAVAHAVTGRRVLIVIDNAQLVRDERAVHLLVDLVREFPDCHLLISGQGRYPLESHALGKVDTTDIPADQLLFSEDEIIELSHVMGADVDAEQAQAIMSVVGGWPAAVALILDERRRAGNSVLPLTRATEYLNDAMRSMLTTRPELRQLAPFAVAERLSNRLIDDVAGLIGTDPARVFELIDATGLVARRYLDDDVELQVPTFVQRAVRDYALVRDPAGVRAMHQYLAGWYGARDCDQEQLWALSHAIAGEQWATLDAIWARRGMALAMSHPAELNELLSGLPEEVLAARPGMLIVLAMTRVTRAGLDSDEDGRRATLQPYIDAARARSDVDLDTLQPSDLLHVGIAQLIGLRLIGRLEQAEQLGDSLRDRLTTIPDVKARAGDRIAWLHFNRGLSASLLAKSGEAVGCYLAAWRNGSGSGSWVPVNAAANLAMTFALQGNLPRAESWLARYATFDTHDQWGHFLISVGARVAKGLVALDRLERELVEEQLEVLGDGSTPLELWPFVVYLHAQFGVHFVDPDMTLTLIDEAERQHRDAGVQGSAATLLLARARADLHLAAGRPRFAAQVLREILTPDQPDAGSTDLPGSEVAPTGLAVPWAHSLMLNGQWRDAATFATAAAVASPTAPHSRLELWLIAGAAARRVGDERAARQAVDHALHLHRYSGGIRGFVRLDAQERAALLECRSLTVPDATLATLLAAPDAYPTPQPRVELTRRERLLVVELRTGASRREIAERLFVSVNTVRTQLATLYRKLGVSTSTQALERITELGLDG